MIYFYFFMQGAWNACIEYIQSIIYYSPEPVDLQNVDEGWFNLEKEQNN